MSDVVIKVENLTKEYRLGVINHGTLAKDLQAWWARKRGKEDPNSPVFAKATTGKPLTPHASRLALPSTHASRITHHDLSSLNEKIYALKDISFSVKSGEVLGIIGANGAGKSTLLKILSRVTSPTSGCVKIKGRIGSLLEVGTGFHPELTGRENIYLNGAILGMKRWEIDKKLDEIIDFSGVEKFIDTPVKRYSSGMYVRLAFAVAAHLDPEILVVDEVLAVGDAEFQKKCLGKMGDISKKEGRTVLFVSHNMGAVRQLCGRGIIIKEGELYNIYNDVELMIKDYLNVEDISKSNKIEWINDEVVGNKYFMPIKVFVEREIFNHNDDINLYLTYRINEFDSNLRFGFVICSEDRQILFTTECTDQKKITIKKGFGKIKAKIPSHFLNEGIYYVELTASSPNIGWIIRPQYNDAIFITFEIKGGFCVSPSWTSKRTGLIAPVLQWSYYD